MTITTTANALLAMSDADLNRLDAILRRFDSQVDTSPPIATPTPHKALSDAPAGVPVQSEELIATKESYKAKFGKGFRLRDGQDEFDKLAIMEACIESGVDNGSLGKAKGEQSISDEDLPEGVSILD